MSSEKSSPSAQSSVAEKMVQSLVYGGGVMLVTSPVLNAFNAVAIRALKEQVGSIGAVSLVYNGGNGKPSGMANFGAGYMDHLGKEVPRLWFKPLGLFFVAPELRKHMSPGEADLAFAAGMSACELAVNPFDKRRVDKQALRTPTTNPRELFAGSLGNFYRQFATWYGFKASGTALNSALEEHTDINPHSAKGILVKAPVQAAVFTSLSYPFEVTTRSVQFSAENQRGPVQTVKDTVQSIIKGKIPKSTYVNAAGKILSSQGTRGFFVGVGAKYCYNTLLAAGAQLLIELGGGTFAKQQQAFERSVGSMFSVSYASPVSVKSTEQKCDDSSPFR